MRMFFAITISVLWSCVAVADTPTLRVGHFPLLTHGSALVIRAVVSGRLPPEEIGALVPPKIRFYTYDSGASAMEALLAGSIDLTFVGPTPLFAAHARFPEAGLAIISGATTGGSALLLRRSVPFTSPADLRGLRIATPQIGNTQDVSCRAWLREHGFTITQQGGDVQVVPTAPANQMLLLQSGELDGTWAVEPWVSRFESELSMRVVHEDTASLATVIVTKKGSRDSRQSEFKHFLALHRAVIHWMQRNPQNAAEIAAREIETLVHRSMPHSLLMRAWQRLSFSDEVDQTRVHAAARDLAASRLVSRSLSLETLEIPHDKRKPN